MEILGLGTCSELAFAHRFLRPCSFFAVLLAWAAPCAAWGQGPVQTTLTRPMGMGQAFRGHGAGNGALYANPAGMSLISTYSVEAAYLNLEGQSVASASVVDTKTSMVGAGLAYSYVPVNEGPDDHGLRVGLSTSLVPQTLTVGILGKYDWLGATDASGFSLDAGVLLALARTIGFGMVAHNLMPAAELGQERSYGFGLAYTGLLTLAFDLVLDPARAGTDMLSYHGGLELLLQNAFPLRLGYEAVPFTSAHYLTMGIGAFSEQAGIQVGFRQRLDDGDEQSLSISFNFFL